MSSISQCRIRSVNKKAFDKALNDLKIKRTGAEELSIDGVRVTVASDNSSSDIVLKYEDIYAGRSKKTIDNLSKLGAYYTMLDKMQQLGLKLVKSTKDPVLAVQANQELVLEFEEPSVKVRA